MADSNPYRKHRASFLETDKASFDLNDVLAPEGTPVQERVCLRCGHYRTGGWCMAKRRDVGPLWEACKNYNTTMETNGTPTTKVCRRCGRELPLEAFAKNKSRTDGLQENCRECMAAYNREYSARKKAGAFTFKPKTEASEAPVAVNPATTEIPDHDLVHELRRRGYDVTCKKTIEL